MYQCTAPCAVCWHPPHTPHPHRHRHRPLPPPPRTRTSWCVSGSRMRCSSLSSSCVGTSTSPDTSPSAAPADRLDSTRRPDSCSDCRPRQHSSRQQCSGRTTVSRHEGEAHTGQTTRLQGAPQTCDMRGGESACVRETWPGYVDMRLARVGKGDSAGDVNKHTHCSTLRSAGHLSCLERLRAVECQTSVQGRCPAPGTLCAHVYNPLLPTRCCLCSG